VVGTAALPPEPRPEPRPEARPEQRPTPQPERQPAPPQEPLLKTLQALWQDLPGLVGDRVDLLGLELQKAGLALAQIAGLVVVVAILCVTGWLLLWVGIVAACVALGLHLAAALGLAMLLNGVAAALAVMRMRWLCTALHLPATRRHLLPARHLPQSKPGPRTDERHPGTAGGQPVAH